MRYLLLLLLTLISLVSCQKKSGLGDGTAPQIYDLAVDGDPFIFTDTASKVLIRFKLLAMDKKFGNPEYTEAINLREFRSDTLYREFAFPFPQLPADILELDFLEADVALPLKGIFFTPRFDSVHVVTMTDTLYMEVYVKDEEGKESNILTTQPLIIKRF